MIKKKVGQKVGVFYFNDARGAKAAVDTIAKISLTGCITLQNGKKYTATGKEIKVIDPSYLCTVKKAKEVIEIANYNKELEENVYTSYLFPKGNLVARNAFSQGSKRSENLEVASKAAKSVITMLNNEGWLSDSNGKRDALRLEIESKILNYVEKCPPKDLTKHNYKLYV